MLFKEKNFICKVIRDSDYFIGKTLKSTISFGGIKKGYCYSNGIFDSIKDMGIVPMDASYVEENSLGNRREIIYSTSKVSADMGSVTTEYRSVRVPRYVEAKDIVNIVASDIKDCLNLFNRFLQNVDITVIPVSEQCPSEDELYSGFWELADLDSSLVTFRNADSSFYCMIGGRKYIIAVSESNNGVRDFLLLATDLSNEGLADYKKLIFNR